MADDFEVETGNDRTNAGFASLDLRTDENRIAGEFPLYLRLGISDCIIEGKETAYRVFFRTGRVEIALEQMEEVWSKGSYGAEFEKTSVTVKQTDKASQKDATGWKLMARMRGYINLSGSAESSGKTEETENVTLTASTKVELIEPLANLQWRVGHQEHGDLRKMGGFLSGHYFMEASKPTCHFKVCGGVETASATATFSVRRSDAHVVKDGQGWHEKPISQGQEADFGAAMMERLRALRLMKSVVPTASWVLARDRMVLTRARDKA
jgi:hypothetical protein